MMLLHGGDLPAGTIGNTIADPLRIRLQTGHADTPQQWQLAADSARNLLTAADPVNSRATPLVVWDWASGLTAVGSEASLTFPAVGMADTGVTLPSDYATSLFAVRLGGTRSTMLLMHGGDLGTAGNARGGGTGTAVTHYVPKTGVTDGANYRLQADSARRLWVWRSSFATAPTAFRVWKVDSPTSVGSATPDLATLLGMRDSGITLPADYATKILAVRFGGANASCRLIWGGDLNTNTVGSTDRVNMMLIAVYNTSTITRLTDPTYYYLGVTAARRLLVSTSPAGGAASPLAVWALN